MLDMLVDWRDTVLGSAAMRDRLGRLPIGRRVARRHADRLFAVVAGAAHAQMLTAAVELGLFSRLSGGPLPRDALFADLGLPQRSADALLQALLALELVEVRRGDRIGLAIDGLVIATDPAVQAMIAHNRLLYEDLQNPVAALRAPGGGRLGAFWPYRGAGDSAGYSAVMAGSQGLVASAVLRAYPFARHRAVLDVGGGDGSFVAALAVRHPRLRLAVAELEGAASLARVALDSRGLGRIAVHARAGEAEPLPTGADAITLLRVLHDRDDESALVLLRQCRKALPPGGTVLVAEPMVRLGRDPQAAYFAIYFMAMGQGRLRSPGEIGTMLRRAGFGRPQVRRPSPLLNILTATTVQTD